MIWSILQTALKSFFSVITDGLKYDEIGCYRIVLAVNRKVIDEHMERLKAKQHQRIEIDEDSLRWTPLISTQMLSDEEKQAEKEVCHAMLLSYSDTEWMN